MVQYARRLIRGRWSSPLSKIQRRIHTASSEQVRQPIYREGLDQWRHFVPWIGPLKEALGDLASS
jgi:hypothetical protein